MRAAIYLRISLDKSGEELGVSRQREDCEKLASMRGVEVVKVLSENDTSAAGKVARPMFEELLKLIETDQVQMVIAWKFDRLTRNRRDTLRLIELGQAKKLIISLAQGSDLDMGTSMGRMFATQLAEWARFEIDEKSDRHKSANAQKARAGKPHGSRRPFGYAKDLVTIYEPEAAVLREMARRLIAGHGYKEIAWWANQQGYRTTTGKLWYPLTVRNILLKKRYGGIREHQGVDYPASWEPVFDSETWQRLQLTMRLRREKHGDMPVGRKYLLTGLLVCGNCGRPLNGSQRRDRPNAPLRRVYYCRMQGDAQREAGCGKVRVNSNALDDFIRECVLFRFTTPALGKLLEASQQTDETISRLLSDRQALQDRINGLVDDYATGLLDRTQFARAKQTAEGQLVVIEAEIELATHARKASVLLPGVMLRKAWEEAESDNWRRELLAMVIERIVINQSIRKPFYRLRDGTPARFDAERVIISWRI